MKCKNFRHFTQLFKQKNTIKIMNLQKLKQFLLDFNLNEEIVEDFLKNKQIKEINKNYFLINKNTNLQKNQIFEETLIFIQLNEFLPSKYLLSFIKENQGLFVEIRNEKQAINFTYSKTLKFASIIKKKGSFENKYLAIYDNEILGYGEFSQNKKEFKNLMNIGEYLKEN